MRLMEFQTWSQRVFELPRMFGSPKVFEFQTLLQRMFELLRLSRRGKDSLRMLGSPKVFEL